MVSHTKGENDDDALEKERWEKQLKVSSSSLTTVHVLHSLPMPCHVHLMITEENRSVQGRHHHGILSCHNHYENEVARRKI